MKQFVIMLSGKTTGTLKTELLEQHVAHLKKLKKENRLVVCGPFLNNSGAMKIIRAENMEEAQQIATRDPFTAESYYQNYEIFELIEANETNNYLLEDTQTKISQRLK